MFLLFASVTLILFLIKWDEICFFVVAPYCPVLHPPLTPFCDRKIQFSHLICGDKKKKNQEKAWLQIICTASSIFSSPSRLTWVNCLFHIPLANVFVLVVVRWICFPWKETDLKVNCIYNNYGIQRWWAAGPNQDGYLGTYICPTGSSSLKREEKRRKENRGVSRETMKVQEP